MYSPIDHMRDAIVPNFPDNKMLKEGGGYLGLSGVSKLYTPRQFFLIPKWFLSFITTTFGVEVDISVYFLYIWGLYYPSYIGNRFC